MFFRIQNLINPITADEPDPAAANILQEASAGNLGEMRTMMQYLLSSGTTVASNAPSNGGYLGEHSYFAFTSMDSEDAGCSAVVGCPDMG